MFSRGEVCPETVTTAKTQSTYTVKTGLSVQILTEFCLYAEKLSAAKPQPNIADIVGKMKKRPLDTKTFDSQRFRVFLRPKTRKPSLNARRARTR
jgi:hypothetical protein